MEREYIPAAETRRAVDNMTDVSKSIGEFVCRMFQRTVVDPRGLGIKVLDMTEDGTKVRVRLECGAVGWVPIEMIYREPQPKYVK